MKWKRFAVLFFGYLLFSVLASVTCEPCGSPFNRYRMKGLTTEIAKMDTTQYYYHLLPVQEGDTVPYDVFAISARPLLEFFQAHHFPSQEFLPTAYACTPADPTTTESLKDLQIYADVDFDASHPAGTNLADVFELFFYQDFKRVKISEYVAQYPSIPLHENWILVLRKPPASPKKFTFTIKTEQFGGKYSSFEAQTKAVILK